MEKQIKASSFQIFSGKQNTVESLRFLLFSLLFSFMKLLIPYNECVIVMLMNELQKEIFHYISHYETVSQSQAAFHFHINSRQLKKEISQINPELNGTAKIVQNGTTLITLKVYDTLQFQALRDRILYGAEENNIQSGRIEQIIYAFLSSDRWIKIDDLADDLYVSRRQISKDMVIVRDFLAQYSLSIETVPHRGMRLTGREISRRILLAHLYTSLQKNTSKIDYSLIADPTILSSVRAAVRAVFHEDNISITDYYGTSLAFHLYASVMRMKNGHCIQKEEIDYPVSEQAKRIAEKLLQKINDSTEISITEGEILYLASHCHAKSSSFRISSSADNETITLIHRFLRAIDEKYHTAFSSDTDLIDRLLLHFIPLRTRIHYGYQMKNAMLDEIRSGYPFEMCLVQDQQDIPERFLGGKLSEDETALIALNLALSFRNNVLPGSSGRFLLVSSLNATSTQLFRQEIIEMLHIREENLDVCTRWDLNYVNLSQYRLILSTVPLYLNTDVPVFRFTLTLTEEKKEMIRNILNGFRGNSLLSLFCPRELFGGLTHYLDIREAVAGMIDAAGNYRQIPEHFKEDILSGMGTYNPVIAENILFLHTKEICQQENWATIAVNDRKLEWNGNDVQIIILCSLKPDSYEDLFLLLDAISRLSSNPKAAEDLIRHPDYRTFCEWIY